MGHLSLRKWITSGVQGSYTRVVLTKTSFLYFVHFTELDLEETISEDDIGKLVFAPDDWIVMKKLDVFVKVGTTDHRAKIESMVRLSEELVDTKSLRVRWIVNNKKEVVDISSVVPMYSSEGNNQKRKATKPAKPSSVISEQTPKPMDGSLEKSNYPRKLLVGLSFKANTSSIATLYLPNKRLQR